LSRFSVKKTLAYLGLTEDEYEEDQAFEDGYAFDDYDEQPVRSSSRRASEGAPRRGPGAPREPYVADPYGSSSQGSRPRPIATHEVAAGTPRVLQPVPVSPQHSGSVRTISSEPAANVTVVMPTAFGDAKRVADQLRAGRPVIVNLQAAPGDVPRRMIDFCAGAVYAISGSMDKVADQVFLLSPSNVLVSPEERARLERRDYGQD